MTGKRFDYEPSTANKKRIETRRFHCRFEGDLATADRHTWLSAFLGLPDPASFLGDLSSDIGDNRTRLPLKSTTKSSVRISRELGQCRLFRAVNDSSVVGQGVGRQRGQLWNVSINGEQGTRATTPSRRVKTHRFLSSMGSPAFSNREYVERSRLQPTGHFSHRRLAIVCPVPTQEDNCALGLDTRNRTIGAVDGLRSGKFCGVGRTGSKRQESQEINSIRQTLFLRSSSNPGGFGFSISSDDELNPFPGAFQPSMSSTASDIQVLFSYGTLQLEAAFATFGRKLNGAADGLPGFEQSLVKIEDASLLLRAGKTPSSDNKVHGRASAIVRNSFRGHPRRTQRRDA
jgi:hypothetical protein